MQTARESAITADASRAITAESPVTPQHVFSNQRLIDASAVKKLEAEGIPILSRRSVKPIYPSISNEYPREILSQMGRKGFDTVRLPEARELTPRNKINKKQL